MLNLCIIAIKPSASHTAGACRLTCVAHPNLVLLQSVLASACSTEFAYGLPWLVLA
jgi:hypothetical protein